MGSNSSDALETTASAIPDEEIVARVLRGETAFFELIVRRYHQRLYRATRAILQDENEVEASLQEAYVRAFSHLDQFAGSAKLSTWLTKIALYEALGRLRLGKRREEMPDPVKSRDNPEGAVEAALDTLPARYRIVFILADIEGMSCAETAECLGINEVSVKTRLHRARNILRTRLERTTRSATRLAFRLEETGSDRMIRLITARLDR
jgi:RNA polymerase sigma-70 factor (ECF subfamily)